jgi:nitric oxide reductase large subunit
MNGGGVMSDQQYNEKDEKDEKEMDKREEKTIEEKYRRDPLSTLVWAAIFIWAGLVFLADNLGYLKDLPVARLFPEGSEFVRPGAWTVVFLGAGLIVLVEVVIRLVVPAYRQPLGGTIFFAVLLFSLGLGNIFGWNLAWPVILIALGLSILLRGPRRRK